jgi:ADP-ribose pyrophosphatase YjhB (NUDIX family)
MSHFLTYAAVYAVLEKDGKVYLMRRANTGYNDGLYGLPSGHVEEGENLFDAMIRELKEETGLDVGAKSLDIVHNVYRLNPQRTYNDYFFACRHFTGEPQNVEPEKCDDARWFDKDNLPEQLVPEVKLALHCAGKGERFSQLDLRKEGRHDRAN